MWSVEAVLECAASGVSDAAGRIWLLMAGELNEIAFVEAEGFLKELARLRLRAREVAGVIRREEGPEEIALAIEEIARALLTASSKASGPVYDSFSGGSSTAIDAAVAPQQASLL